MVGVVGHRDLTDFGGVSPVTERLQQTFMKLVADRGVVGMVTGYAPGTDQAAVEAWASLELPKPVIIFPFAGQNSEAQNVYYTEEPAFATTETTIVEPAAREIGVPLLPEDSDGHRAQADALLRRADIIVFVVDEAKKVLSGGSGDTLAKAREMQRDIMIISPDR